MDFGEVDSSALNPYNIKKSCGTRVGSDLFGSVSMLGYGNSLVEGRVQFGSLLLRTDQTTTLILVEVPS